MNRRRKVNYKRVNPSKRTKRDTRFSLISIILASLTLIVFTIIGFSLSLYNINAESFEDNINEIKIEEKLIENNNTDEVSAIFTADTSLSSTITGEIVECIETIEINEEKLVYGEEVKSTMEEELEFVPYHTNLKDTYENNLYWLSHIIYAESGSSYCTDELQLLVGSVVLNRVNNSNYPDSIYNVIHDPGQYQPTWNGAINKEPDERAINNAKYLLDNGPIEPNIIFQAEFSQGSNTYKIIDICINGNKVSEMYFCY